MAGLDYGLLDGNGEDNAFDREHSLLGQEGDADARESSWFNFTRTTTNLTLGEAVFGRELTFTRGVTEALGLNYDSEEAWTRTLIDAYAFGEEITERVGDVPWYEPGGASLGRDSSKHRRCVWQRGGHEGFWEEGPAQRRVQADAAL